MSMVVQWRSDILLGATGAKLMTTMLHELERRDGNYALQAICEGGGTANATIIKRIA
jgi:Acetyl-CoA acetyltransferase